MKKLIVLACFSILSAGAFAQEAPLAEAVPPFEEASLLEAGTPAEGPRLYLLFSEGTACSWLTRIIRQTGRSNFVYEDFLPGLYFRMDLNMSQIFLPMVRVAVLYPLVSTFNRFEQKPANPLHLGIDMNLGANISILEFAYFRLNAGPAWHMFFLNSDRWNYFNMGAAAFINMELPLAGSWTLIGNGIASLDNGNLGANRNMEPFDIVYQYQIDIGVRYSKKQRNSTYLFPVNKPAREAPVFSR